MKNSLIMILLAVLACSPPKEDKPSQSKNEGPAVTWRYLFNGRDLEGWEKKNGTAPYAVENGVIVGRTIRDTPNTFLCTEEDFADFIIEFEVLVDSTMNSGVQFRSNSISSYQDGRVHGYQCEIDPSERSWSGGIYDEGRRGWLYDLQNNPEGRMAFVNGQWNAYRIEAIGDTLRSWVNGVNTANLVDTVTSSGFIGLQVHSIGKGDDPGRIVQWRNIRIMQDPVRDSLWTKKVTAPLISLAR